VTVIKPVPPRRRLRVLHDRLRAALQAVVRRGAVGGPAAELLGRPLVPTWFADALGRLEAAGLARRDAAGVYRVTEDGAEHAARNRGFRLLTGHGGHLDGPREKRVYTLRPLRPGTGHRDEGPGPWWENAVRAIEDAPGDADEFDEYTRAAA
jgi:DNA-binding PadR family transcriptional regulator